MQLKETQSKYEEAEAEGLLVTEKVDEAGQKASLSDKAAIEAENAKKMAEEARAAAEWVPSNPMRSLAKSSFKAWCILRKNRLDCPIAVGAPYSPTYVSC